MDFGKEQMEAVRYLAFFLLAFFGGLLGHVMRALEHGHEIRWVYVFLQGAAAGFVGLLVTMLCRAMGLSDQWTGVVVGVFGWMGANATVRIIEAVILKKLGISKEHIRGEP